MRQIQRVKRGPAHPPLPLPKDAWRECIFMEADGTEFVVVYSGKHMPSVELLRTSRPCLHTIGHPLVRP